MSAGRQKTILGIGGAHIDRRGRMSVDFVPGASNPGTLREDVGGGTFNALRNAVQRGVDGRLLSVRGGDTAGETVARAIAAAGIRDLSVTFLDRRTPSYTALLDRQGDVIAALADMGLYELALGKQLRRASVRSAVAEADAVFTDANLSADALARIPKLAGEKPVFAIAISPAKVLRLKAILPALSCLFLNMREACALTGLGPDAPAPAMLRALKALGLKRAVLSSGPGPVAALDGETLFSIAPPAPRGITDVTGAGDALAGAAAAALMRDLAFADAVREGMAAALLALESTDAAPVLSRAAFDAALALVPQALSSGTTDYLWCMSIFEKDSDGFVAELPTNLDTRAVLSLFRETDPKRIRGELSVGSEQREQVQHLTGMEIDLERFDYFIGARSVT